MKAARVPWGLAVLLFVICLPADAVWAEEELHIGGEVTVGFGVLRRDAPARTQPDGVGEATLSAEAAKGPVSARLELTVADSAEELDTAEHEVAWRPVEALAIVISGRSFGLQPEDGNLSIVNAPAGPVGDEEARIDFADTGLLNVEYTVGGTVLGLAVLDACVPACGYGLDAEGASLYPEDEPSTLVAHLRGESEPLAYNAYLARSSGKFAESDGSGSGNGTGAGLGLVFEGSGYRLGLDAARITVTCNPAAGSTPCADDNTQQRWGVAVTVGGFAAHYVAISDETGPDTEKTASVDVVYLWDVMGATVGPEYRTTTVTAPDDTDSTASFLLFGMSLAF